MKLTDIQEENQGVCGYRGDKEEGGKDDTRMPDLNNWMNFLRWRKPEDKFGGKDPEFSDLVRQGCPGEI